MDDLTLAVGRLEGKVDQILDILPSQEERIRSLEQSRSRQTGAAAAVAGIVSLATGFIGYIIHKP